MTDRQWFINNQSYIDALLWKVHQLFIEHYTDSHKQYRWMKMTELVDLVHQSTGWDKPTPPIEYPECTKRVRGLYHKKCRQYLERFVEHKQPALRVLGSVGQSEADIQAELYHQLRLLNIDVRLEVTVPSLLHKSNKMRIDVAIMKHERIIAAIEVKKPDIKTKQVKKQQRQAYAQLQHKHGIDVYWLNDFNKAAMLAKAIHSHYFIREPLTS